MSLVALGEFSSEREALIASAVKRANRHASFHASASLARAELEQHHAHCLLIDVAMTRAAELISWVRGEGALFDLPVIALIDSPTDNAFFEALRLGADDAVARTDMNAITRRAALLDDYVPGALPPASHESVLLAHSDTARRRVLGRSLRHAGYQVLFASNAQELEQEVLKRQPSIVVLAEELGGESTAQLIARLRRAAGNDALPCVVIAVRATRAIDAAARQVELRHMRGLMPPRVASVLDDQPNDQVLFVVNELMRPEINDVRASPRVLYSTLLSFRPAGEFSPAYGMSSNLSREGLFVRTMDSPRKESTVWVELRPHGDAAAVHLRARVVWVRDLRHGSGGPSPPGFGARILPEACAPDDLKRYLNGYQALRDELS